MIKEKFEVKGYFYNVDKLKFRRYLEIKKIGTKKNKNDISIIMMNPGSSEPKNIDEDKNSDFLDRFVIAHPDPTQNQIMEVMENCGFEYAKIINLSDVRNGNSKLFYELLDKDLKGKVHSIFSNEDCIKGYLNPNSAFLFAWGVNHKLKELSQNALNQIEKLFGKDLKIHGLKHSKNSVGYYHPFPRTKTAQDNWVINITKQIKNYG